jgi:hypothetical protein
LRRPAFWQQISQRADWRLTSHFFGAMFDFGILTPAGADSFIHALLGAVGALIAVGLGFVRVYAVKYALLSAARSPDPYRTAVLGDDLFLIGLSMLLIALLTLVVSQSLFPDERDFRILGPLPVRRIVIFRAKLAALFLFTGIFAAILHLSLAPLAVLMSLSQYSEHAAVARLLAWMMASMSASVFSVLAVAAIVGVLSLVVSRTRLHSFTAIVRSVMFALLVVALPFVFRLPALGRPMSLHATWLAMLPPAWFVGLQRSLLGHADPWFLYLAEIALTALGVGALVVASAYVLLFRHFEHLLLRPPSISAPWLSRDSDQSRPRIMSTRSAHIDGSAAFRAVYRFTSATLRRSELHQGVLLALSACGVALTSSRLVGAGWLSRAGISGSVDTIRAHVYLRAQRSRGDRITDDTSRQLDLSVDRDRGDSQRADARGGTDRHRLCRRTAAGCRITGVVVDHRIEKGRDRHADRRVRWRRLRSRRPAGMATNPVHLLVHAW